MFCNIVPWLILGYGLGRCNDRHNCPPPPPPPPPPCPDHNGFRRRCCRKH